MNLKPGLADEADPKHANRNAGEMTGAHGKIRKRRGGKIDVGVQPLDHGPRLRAGDVDAGIGRGDIGDIDVEPPLLVPETHQPVDLVDRTGRRRDIEVLIMQATCDAVIDDDAGLVGQQRIARASDRLLEKIEGIKAVDESRGVGTANVEFAQRRDVDNADILAHGPDLGDDRLRALLLRAVVGRSQPQSRRHHAGAQRQMPVVHRREPGRLIAASGKMAELLRHQRRPERRCADLLDIAAGGPRHHADGVEIGMAALTGSKPRGGVALDELDVVVAVVHGIDDVAGPQIFVEIDEVLAASGLGDRPWMGDIPCRRVFRCRGRGGIPAESRLRGRASDLCAMIAGKRFRPDASDRAGCAHTGRQIGGPMHRDGGIVDDFRAGVAR